MAYLAEEVAVKDASVASRPCQALQAGVILLLLTVAVRWPFFGDPNYHIDEAFYLLVGQKMHDGLMPYIEIWDRKPFGLFILYWLFASFGGVAAYQIAAGISVWLTGCTVAAIARRFARPLPSFAAGAAYILLPQTLAGGGGQSPIFYNLFITLAALLCVNAAQSNASGIITRYGISAMLLCGLAIVIKPTAIVEGMFFGLWFCWLYWRRDRGLLPWVSGTLLLIVTGALPTLAIFAYFAATGHLDTYWFASVESIFLTAPLPADELWKNGRWLLIVMFPLLAASAGGMFLLHRQSSISADLRAFLTLWVLAALGGFFMVPNFYDHYALPLLAPLSLVAALFFQRRPTGAVLFAVIALWSLYLSGYPRTNYVPEAKAGFAEAQRLIGDNIGDGCLFVYDATPALYRAHSSCLPTKLIFPRHLSAAREARATHTDPATEIDRIFAQDITVVAIASKPSVRMYNAATRAMVRQKLAAGYRLVGSSRILKNSGESNVEIWVRKAG